MDTHPDPGSRIVPLRAEGGFVTAQFMVVTALSMAFMALLLYLIALQYAQGVVRSALDEGVRVGAPAAATETDCLDAINRVLSDLMGGPLGQDLTVSCAFAAERVVASAQGAFSGWFPGVPDVSFQLEVAGVKESDD
ncbi:MAG: hypothetical protein ACRDWA_16785 [Acidimicrobiia bacterium]